MYEEIDTAGNEAKGAVVYHMLQGDTGLFEPFQNSREYPFQTNPAGYLGGFGVIRTGDQLVAMLPITATESYTLYHTSATPTLTGLDAYTVSAGGVQTLTVSADNPLLLFNLDVSLEWDATEDVRFKEQLNYDLQRTSALIYDWSNGQAALGRIRIYQNRDHWNEAHLRIYATNRLRPNADLGGVVSDVVSETITNSLGITNTISYVPGQVRMGASWNRFGDAYGTLGEDWPRTLAHEFSHYLFHLDDNYLGLDPAGNLIAVDTCPGVMADPYRDDDVSAYDEYHPAGNWLPGCQDTLSNHLTGRSDWDTIRAFYPGLNEVDNFGPNSLPLAVTNLQFISPSVPTNPLDAPVFNLATEEGELYLASSHARAYLFQVDHLIDLGRPQLDKVNAYGAAPGNTLCVYDETNRRQGCEVIKAYDEQLVMGQIAGWEPDVLVTPVTSDTFNIQIDNLLPGLNLYTRLYPVDDPPSHSQELIFSSGTYSTTFIDLPYPVLDGNVYITATNSAGSVISNFSLGGSPVQIHSRGVRIRSRGVRIHSRGAPLTSVDGQVVLYAENLVFPEDEFFTIQTVSRLPVPPTWATVIGQAYRLTTSPGAPDLTGTSINFSYMEAEVPPGEEAWIKVYFFDGQNWQPLPTTPDRDSNYAIAQSVGPEIYVLMSSLEIGLNDAGWNSLRLSY